MAAKIKSKPKITAELIADYFIWKSQEEKKPITNKKLQKLLYYAQAWHLVLSDEGTPLFKDKIEAWVHGPAIKDIYFSFKQFGFNPIEKHVSKNAIKKIDQDTIELLDAVWDIYGKYDADYLEGLTHSELPWQNARAGLECDEASSNEITLKDMKQFYSELLRKNERQSNPKHPAKK